MKSMTQRGARCPLLAVLALSLILGGGCSPKLTNRETLDYFYGLVTSTFSARPAKPRR